VVESTLGDELSLIKRTISAIMSAPEYKVKTEPVQGEIMTFLGIPTRKGKGNDKKRDSKAKKGMSWGNISVSAGDVNILVLVGGRC
jgi:hypothetical protein